MHNAAIRREVVVVVPVVAPTTNPEPTHNQATTSRADKISGLLSVNQMCELLKRTGSHCPGNLSAVRIRHVLRIEEPRLWSINAAKMHAIGELHKQLGALPGEPYYSDRHCKG